MYAGKRRGNVVTNQVDAVLQAQIDEQSRQEARLSKMEGEVATAQQKGNHETGNETGKMPEAPVELRWEKRVVDGRVLRNSIPAQPVTDGPALPAGSRSSRPVPAEVSTTTPITEPPTLELDLYTEWKQSIRFWSDVRGDSPGSQLVAQLALYSEGAMKILLTNYMRESASRPETRNLEEVIALSDKEFDRPD